MRKILFLLFCVSVSVSGFSQNWQPVTAAVGFSLKMFGVSVEGKFKGLNAVIKFDPENLASNSIVATIDATTIDTDNTLRNRHLREKEDFFEVAKYPKISMKSTKIEKTANGYYGVITVVLFSQEVVGHPILNVVYIKFIRIRTKLWHWVKTMVCV